MTFFSNRIKKENSERERSEHLSPRPGLWVTLEAEGVRSATNAPALESTTYDHLRP